MSRRLDCTHKSPRNHIRFGGDLVENPQEYGPTLDCVYEMTSDTADANGVPYSQAIEQVLQTNGWSILPTHKRNILERLEAGL